MLSVKHSGPLLDNRLFAQCVNYWAQIKDPSLTPGFTLKYSVAPLCWTCCGVDWPGSVGCYPLTAVTMRVAVVDREVSLLSWGLVGRQGLRAGCVDSASHEHLVEVTLSVLQWAEKGFPQDMLPLSGPVLSWCQPAALWKSHRLSTLLS